MAVQKQAVKATKESVAKKDKRSGAKAIHNSRQEALAGGLTEKQAMKWFVDKIKANKVDNLAKRDQRITIGRMYTYQYDAKHKATLPYWDAQPLVIVVGLYNDGFLGLNLHYLPPPLRQWLMLHLIQAFERGKVDPRKGTDTRYLKIAYGALLGVSKLRAFKPCLKRYLFTHMRSRPTKIPAVEWLHAIMLPTAKWQKAKAADVYRDSRRAIR